MIHRIDHGHLEFNDRKIVISDNVRSAHYISLGLSIALILQSSVNMAKWINGGNPIDAFDYIYVPVLIIGIGLFIHQMRFSTITELDIGDVQHLKYVERFGNSWVDIYTDNKIRRVVSTKTTYKLLNDWQQTNAIKASEVRI